MEFPTNHNLFYSMMRIGNFLCVNEGVLFLLAVDKKRVAKAVPIHAPRITKKSQERLVE